MTAEEAIYSVADLSDDSSEGEVIKEYVEHLGYHPIKEPDTRSYLALTFEPTTNEEPEENTPGLRNSPTPPPNPEYATFDAGGSPKNRLEIPQGNYTLRLERCFEDLREENNEHGEKTKLYKREQWHYDLNAEDDVMMGNFIDLRVVSLYEGTGHYEDYHVYPTFAKIAKIGKISLKPGDCTLMLVGDLQDIFLRPDDGRLFLKRTSRNEGNRMGDKHPVNPKYFLRVLDG